MSTYAQRRKPLIQCPKRPAISADLLASDATHAGVDQPNVRPHNQVAINGPAAVLETLEILLDSVTLVADLEKIELMEALEGVEQRLRGA